MIQTKTNSIQLASVQLMEAWKKNDFEVLNDLLHKDFQFVNAHVTGYRYNKLQWLEVAANKYKLSHFKYEFLTLTEADPVAINLSKLTIISSATINDQPNVYLASDVWKYEQSAWKLLLRQVVLID
jgi:hypothetical protein